MMNRVVVINAGLLLFIAALTLCLSHDGAAETSSVRDDLIAVDGFDVEALGAVGTGFGWKSPWKLSKVQPAEVANVHLRYGNGISLTDGRAVEIRGTGDRNNPLRRQLAEAYTDDELFVRFLLRYDAGSIDLAGQGDGEFLVLWLDDIDGSDGATHNAFVPNIGLHVAATGPNRGKNVFMLRIGAANTAFSDIEVAGDTTYLVVARLAKSRSGAFENYDTVQMWINPQATDQLKPDASVEYPRSVNLVQWIGFATGKKTEASDRLWLDQLAIGRSWESVLGLPPAETSGPTSAAVPKVDFATQVYPLLKTRCFACHQGPDAESSVRLDAQDEILGYGSGQPLVVLGSSSASRLIELVSPTANSDQQMPPEGEGVPLDGDEIALLKTWIDQGMDWDDTLLPPPKIETDHWAFQPIKRPNVPRYDPKFAATPVDAFITRGHNNAGLSPAVRAQRAVLIRRLSLDLLGLPPTIEEVRRFEQDQSPNAYERLVDQLLASPRYGERWGRHWLDLARWAESNGHQHNRARDHAWRYRDYVVRAFNTDKPYSRFLREQIAGDEMPQYTDENIIATGFLSAARYSGNELDKRLQRNEILNDVTNATASAVLGLTLECAQCHNHKFDPITARDYYRFQGFFLKGQPVNVVLKDATSGQQESRAAWIAERQQIFDTVHQRLVRAERKRRPGEEILIIPKNVVKGMHDNERRRYDELGSRIATLPQTWAYYSPVTSSTALEVPPLELRWPLPFNRDLLAQLQPRLLVRGDIDSPGPSVGIGWPAFFGGQANIESLPSRPRLALVDWLVDRDNPLTARVWANRIWHFHFGRGLVTETSNFGTGTPPPSHPELLDWLACELMDNQWSAKHLHRMIVLSATYQMSSAFSAENMAIDPDNHLLWRWLPRRLEAEAVRDSILAVTDELNTDLGGPSVKASDSRRGIYVFQKRGDLPPMQQLFDGPSTLASCSRRRVSTVPLQPLFLLNNPSMQRRAESLAARVHEAAGERPDRQVELAFGICLARRPTANELERCVAFLRQREQATDQKGTKNTVPTREQLVRFCHAMLNLNEFVYIP